MTRGHALAEDYVSILSGAVWKCRADSRATGQGAGAVAACASRKMGRLAVAKRGMRGSQARLAAQRTVHGHDRWRMARGSRGGGAEGEQCPDGRLLRAGQRESCGAER